MQFINNQQLEIAKEADHQWLMLLLGINMMHGKNCLIQKLLNNRLSRCSLTNSKKLARLK